MTKRTDSANKGEGGDGVALPPPPGPKDNLHFHANNKVYKSGHLLLSSKGIGWTSWKKRWFILTRTSLVFFRSDPNAIPLKGNEVNVTLGGIDLNSSGSVVVKEDKKLLTVLFADGRDGRTFTVKAETLENLHEWKTALEEALADAPSVALDVGQNGIFKNDQTNAADVSSEQTKDGLPVKSLVIGRPILLALEEIDGSPSFLEKALRFVEEHGVKVEGILRQAADVEDVERRIHEYEQGKNEFSPAEDAHVIADCVKFVLRELPSSPVPASCCNALLEAYRTKCSMRVSAMCTAICETFPEPNRRLLQRILLMMQSVASHNTETRMSTSGVAACMAPLLLRPLLAGDCDLGRNFDNVGDGSVQLLQAAAAANLAQAIIITLLDEYDKIFGEGSMSADLYSESEGSGSDSKEFTDDDEDYTTEGSDVDIDDDVEDAYDATSCESDETRDSARLQGSQPLNSGYKHPQGDDADRPIQTLSESSLPEVGLHQDSRKGCGDVSNIRDENIAQPSATGAIFVPKDAETSISAKSDTSKGSVPGDRQTTVSGHTTGEKKLPMESTDLRLEEEKEIQMLEATKTDLQNKIAQQSKENLRLQDEIEKRKNTLQERRLALENEVTRLQEQLEKERELRTTLEAGLKTSHGHLVVSSAMDKKVKADFEEIAQAEVDIASLKQKADGLGRQLNQQREQNSRFQDDVVGQQHLSPNDNLERNDNHKQVDTPSTLHGHQKLARSKVSRERRTAETVLGHFEGTTVLEKNDNFPDKSNMDNDNRKQESVMLTNENALQNQQTDQSQNKKSDRLSASTSVQEGLERPASVNAKRPSINEGTANTISSALSKLSMRLKLLREGQTQIKNEIQQEGMDITRTSVENPGATLEAGGQNVVKSQVCDWKPPEANQGSTSKKQSNLSSESHSDKATRPDSQPYLDRETAKSGPPTEKDGTTAKRTDSR